MKALSDIPAATLAVLIDLFECKYPPIATDQALTDINKINFAAGQRSVLNDLRGALAERKRRGEGDGG